MLKRSRLNVLVTYDALRSAPSRTKCKGYYWDLLATLTSGTGHWKLGPSLLRSFLNSSASRTSQSVIQIPSFFRCFIRPPHRLRFMLYMCVRSLSLVDWTDVEILCIVRVLPIMVKINLSCFYFLADFEIIFCWDFSACTKVIYQIDNFICTDPVKSFDDGVGRKYFDSKLNGIE